MFYRVYSGSRADAVTLEGLFDGAIAFLVGGSPRLLELDCRLFNLQGVWSMAINNAAIVFEPQAFISLDRTECFNYNIFSNSRIMKFVNYSRILEEVDGRRVCREPNTFYFDCEDRAPAFFCLDRGPLVYWKNTFFTALSCLYQLGFEKVNLVGCVFDIDPNNQYAQEVPKLDKNLIEYNKMVYDGAVSYMGELVLRLNDEGFYVRTCHDGTSLEGICPYVPFEEAIEEAVLKSNARFGNIVHANE